MKQAVRSLQIAFTYIGTVVGAGFATGQEIIQFFSKYGSTAVWTIAAASFLFAWLGSKMMLIAHRIGAVTHEDLNRHLFGERMGKWISVFYWIVLFGTSSVMLAGGGSTFHEHLGLPSQFGLLFTLALGYIVIRKGMSGILIVNSIVVPFMLLFTTLVVLHVSTLPDAGMFWNAPNRLDPLNAWIAPLLYSAFNLAMVQAVLVPLGGQIKNRTVLRVGGWLGGLGIGAMLMAGHYALSAHMPGVLDYDIPMGAIAAGLGELIRVLYLVMIYAEIFTTFIGDMYGSTLQLSAQRWLPVKKAAVLPLLLVASYAISLVGFKSLLSTLYPLFGTLSLLWFVMLLHDRSRAASR